MATFAFYSEKNLAGDCAKDKRKHGYGNSRNVASKKVGKINISPLNLFDTSSKKEGYPVHRVINSLHYRTRETTILDALPFKTGDVYDPNLIAEAERILRKKRYIRDAKLTATALCDDTVDIKVITVDNWTLTPSISFSTAGGQETYKLELQDVNFLGTGKEIKYLDSTDAQGRRRSALYKDDNWLRTQRQLNLSGGQDDAGEHFGFKLEHPFLTSNSTKSWKLSYNSEHIANNPNTLDTIIRTQNVDLFYAKKQVAMPGIVRRTGFGVRQQYEKTVQGGIDERRYDFSNIYPYLYLYWDESTWQKRTNFSGFGKVEDLRIGSVADLKIGTISRFLGNDRNTLLLEANYLRRWGTHYNNLHTLSFSPQIYLGNGENEKWRFDASYQHHYWFSEKKQLNTRILYQQQRGFSSFHDFEIGGSHGLSGYPDAYQAGDTRVIASTELRHVNHWNPYNLAHTALHAFAEVGQVRTESEKNSLLADVGIGFALSPTRSSKLSVVRFDVVVPLSNTDEVKGIQIYIGASIEY